MSVDENISDGKYNNNLVIGGSSIPPPGLRLLEQKRVRDLTEEDLAALPQLKKEFEALKAQRKTTTAEWRAEENRLDALFESDCAEEEGLLKHPKREQIFQKAKSMAGTSSKSEIWYAYQELAEFLKN